LECRLHEDDILSIIKDEMQDISYRAKVEEESRKNRLRTKDDYICSVCTSSICVGVTGNVFPCAGWQGCVLGNLKETSLKDIWMSSEKAVWLRSLKRKDLKKCDSCKYSDYCTICLVRNANESKSGNPLEVNEFFCKVAKMKKEALISP
jgi:radical SAM protein with 4Fe4S-binding SPASM domain